MTLQEYFDSIDLSEIKRMISDKQEENLVLEFKTVNHPNSSVDGKKTDQKNFSKALSGFANSSGGIIIWGVIAKKNESDQDVADELKPINELTRFLNILNRSEGQAITPPINGVRHEKIEIDSDTGLIKTLVPPSETAPHIANFAGNYYYKRSGDSFYRCEHYDIVDIFSRKKSAKLEIQVEPHSIELIHQTNRRFSFLISILNVGVSIAKFPYIALRFSESIRLNEMGLGNGNRGLVPVQNNKDYTLNYSGGSEIVIYPKSKLDVDIVFFEKPKEISERPDLVITYFLAAENMDIIKSSITV